MNYNFTTTSEELETEIHEFSLDKDRKHKPTYCICSISITNY